jgi:acetyltransferase-like isoleucine patch superfamily enzyme
MKIARELIQRIYYYKFYFKVAKIGKNIKLSSGGRFVHPEEITLGNNVFVSNNFHISANNLKIGNNIMAGPNLVIECTNHKSNVVGQSMFEVSYDKICGSVSIEDDVWLGANVTILPNAVISEGTVVGAGSVVTKPLPPYSICLGIPCRPVKRRFSETELKKHLESVKTSKYQIEEILHQWKLFNL